MHCHSQMTKSSERIISDSMAGKEEDSWSLLILSFPLFFPCQSSSSSPSAPGGLCLDRIEFSGANMDKALSRLCMANVSVERVISPALPATPTYSLASGSQSADLCCWGDLVFHVGYLKSTNTSISLSLSLFSTHSLFHYLVHWLSCNHITYPSPIPLYRSVLSLPPSSLFSIFFFFCSLLPRRLLLHLFPLLYLSLCQSSSSVSQHLLMGGFAQCEVSGCCTSLLNRGVGSDF